MNKHRVTQREPECATCGKQEGFDNKLADCSTCGETYCSAPCFSLHTPKPAETGASR